MFLMLTISAENLARDDDIVWEFSLRTFNLREQPNKRKRMLKNNKVWKKQVYICLPYVQDENQDMLMQ